MKRPNTNVKSKSKSPKSTKAHKRDSVADSNIPNSKSADNVHLSGAINDPGYYFSNELLKTQLGTISFDDFTGLPLKFKDGTINDNIPYAMRIYLNPSAGFTSEQDSMARGSALNLAGLQTYTSLTASNAKTSSYGPQDVTTLILALGSLISAVSYAKRAFGTVYTYSMRNRAYPEKIINVMGLDYDDLVSNLANYRAQFNALMNQISKIPIPKNIKYFDKCDELYAGIYQDMMGSPMAQTYVFVPESTWLLDETGSEEGTVLRTYELVDSSSPDELITMQLVLGYIRQQVAALLESSTMTKIYPDILRLNQANAMPLWYFDLLLDTYSVIPTYHPDIRKWINNLSIMGKPTGTPESGYTTSNNVMPDADTNKIVYRPQFKNPSRYNYMERILNFDYGTYTVDDIITATRLMATAETKLVGSEYVTTAVALPDHYVTAISIFTVSDNTITVRSNVIHNNVPVILVALSDFDYAPFVTMINPTGDVYEGLFGDLNFYTTLDYKYLNNLQESTYFGLFELR